MKRRTGARLFPLIPGFGPAFALWWQAGSLLTGSGEVIGRRMNLMNRALAGETAFPYAEVTRMWQEKAAAGLALYFRLNRNFLSNLPLLTRQLQGLPATAAMLENQLKGMSALLRPYSTTVHANRRRLGRRSR